MPLVRVAVPVPLPGHEHLVYSIPDEEPVTPGLRVLVPMRARQVWGTVLGAEPARAEAPTYKIRSISGIPEPRLVLSEEILSLARWVADYYAATLGEVLHAAAPALTGLKRRASRAAPLEEEGWHAAPPPERAALNEDQSRALTDIETGIASRAFAPFLLYGVTGSGKTAVYLHAARSAIATGGQALILVPEIALSPQALDSFRRAGFQRAAVYHSGLLPRERADVWRAVAAGELDLVVGTRSAVFLPFPDLRLTVIDEEQDGAYKQDESPRYHARDVALVRAQRRGTAVVLATATPSLESYAQAVRGAYKLLELPRRVDGRPLAVVKLADLRAGRAIAEAARAAGNSATAGNRGTGSALSGSRFFTPVLTDAIARTLERGEQGILFLNRRGHSTYLQCRGCGHVAKCDRCDVPYTVHTDEAILRCHYCGARKKVPASCGACHAADLWFGGLGIQKVEREVERLFPSARLARLDFDSVRKRGSASTILRAFRERDTDFLLGTQMVTKGFDFPGVTLVGVIVADLSLYLPDFRAAERTFQLLTQVAGRAGRGDAPGEVIMQSYDPEHPALRAAAAQDYATFFAQESAERKELLYPPFGRLVEIELRGKKSERVQAVGDAIRRLVGKAAAGRPVEILGPAPKPLARLKGEERWHLLLRSGSRSALRETVAAALPLLRELRHPGTRWAIDVDPYQLL
jgi:primosomal protein N' (replication factor Y)